MIGRVAGLLARLVARLVAGLVAGLVAAAPGAAAVAPPGAGAAAACAAAAAAAERRWSLPANLLLAIGTVETGRRDAAGRRAPWPWSADVAGQDYVFASDSEAVTVVGFLRQHGIASIDVGCFQVNLHYHPNAFASLAQGFDPMVNGDYAARFLRSLYARSGSWPAAIAEYHSADPVLGADYRRRVLLAWDALGVLPGSAAATPQATRADPYVILAAAGAAGIPVYTAQTLPTAYRPLLGLAAARPATP